MNQKRNEQPKSSSNQKWRKKGDCWKHDYLPIRILTGEAGYQVQFRTPASWSAKIAKSQRGNKWYGLEKAKLIARRIEREIEPLWAEARAS